MEPSKDLNTSPIHVSGHAPGPARPEDDSQRQEVDCAQPHADGDPPELQATSESGWTENGTLGRASELRGRREPSLHRDSVQAMESVISDARDDVSPKLFVQRKVHELLGVASNVLRNVSQRGFLRLGGRSANNRGGDQEH